MSLFDVLVTLKLVTRMTGEAWLYSVYTYDGGITDLTATQRTMVRVNPSSRRLLAEYIRTQTVILSMWRMRSSPARPSSRNRGGVLDPVVES